jgi:3-oxoacyl-[acyl-carrier protein] reductase
MTDLKNKVAVITGGAGGIGSAISKRLASAGVTVIVTYNNNADKAFELVRSLDGNNHAAVHAPVDKGPELIKLTDFVTGKYGKLDILVNNAGITTHVSHEDLDGLTDDWIDKIFSTNFRGSFAMIRACKNLLLQSDDALIVNISSVAAISGIGSNVAYCASKAAIDSMTRSLARALAPTIRVVSVSPGWVMGDYAKNVNAEFLQKAIGCNSAKPVCSPGRCSRCGVCTGNYIKIYDRKCYTCRRRKTVELISDCGLRIWNP